MVEVFTDIGLDGLKKWLAAAREIMKTDQQRAMENALHAVSIFLKGKGIEPDLLRPLDDLAVGFFDLQNGNHPNFFKPNRDAARTMRFSDAVRMALASAAITLAPKGQTRDDIIAKAARKLGVKRSKIMNFRTALRARRIKSPTATELYDWYVTIHAKEGDEDRHTVSKYLLYTIDK